MAIHADILGLKASVLLDTRSTINAMSPEFARVARVPTFELSNPISLQLGCVGSWSKANFGAETAIIIAGNPHRTYLNIVNVPKYDVVLGLPFMHQTKMVLDFGNYTVKIESTVLPILRGKGPGQRNARTRGQRDQEETVSVHSVRVVAQDE